MVLWVNRIQLDSSCQTSLIHIMWLWLDVNGYSDLTLPRNRFQIFSGNIFFMPPIDIHRHLVISFNRGIVVNLPFIQNSELLYMMWGRFFTHMNIHFSQYVLLKMFFSHWISLVYIYYIWKLIVHTSMKCSSISLFPILLH